MNSIVPILLIAYKKYDTTLKVFEHFRVARPKRLFIAFNAPDPNKQDDVEKCNRVRELVKLVDWNCELVVKYRERHLLVTESYLDSISWFFEKVESGIILDDDCVPNLSFYNFCRILLEHYKDDNRVMHINGSNFCSHRITGSDYFFSNIPSCWGWATWKRAWDKIDLNTLNGLSDESFESIVRSKIVGRFYQNKFIALINHFRDRKLDQIAGPDWIWTFHIWTNGGLTIVPSVNLVNNIGIGNSEGISSGNTKREVILANVKTEEIRENIAFQDRMVVNSQYDKKLARVYFPTHFLTELLFYVGQWLPRSIKSQLKSVVK